MMYCHTRFTKIHMLQALRASLEKNRNFQDALGTRVLFARIDQTHTNYTVTITFFFIRPEKSVIISINFVFTEYNSSLQNTPLCYEVSQIRW